MDTTSLVDDLEVLPHRVAGHAYEDGGKAGIAREKTTGFILKVIDGDERGQRELKFYQEIYKSDEPDMVTLRSFCPSFHGTRIIRGRTFLRLGNVSFDGSNVMDVKIGAVTWDHLASEEKVKIEKAKYTWQEQLCFKILGYRLTRSNGQVVILEKSKANKMNPEEVQLAIWTFLSPDGDEIIRDRRAELILQQLTQIKKLIERQSLFRFISSSILLSYQNVPSNSGDTKVRATMIDFAHTHEMQGDEVDVNYLNGLSSFITFFNPRHE